MITPLDQKGTYEELIILDEPKELILSGRWDSTFTTLISDTKIKSMRISDGTLTTEYFVIQ